MRALAHVVLAVVALAPSVDPGRITDAASYQVYAAVLALDPHARGVPRVFLRGETRADGGCLPPDAVPGEWKPALADYVRRNREPRELDGHESMANRVQMVASAWIDEIVSKAGEWEFFWSETPNAFDIHIGPGDEVLFEVSAVGFDRARRHAIVSLAHHAGGDSGVGTVWLLERRGGRWVPFTTFEQCRWGAGTSAPEFQGLR